MGPPTPAALATSSTASSVQPPTKTASRRNSRRSSSSSRSWLQAMAPRSVCWRAGRSRAPPVSSGSRRSRRASIAWGDSSRTRAAASSIASGSPSSRWQISATAGPLSSVRTKSGVIAAARSTKRATAANRDSASAAGGCCRSGRASGGTGRSCSPLSPSGARLVASTVSPGLAPSSSLTTVAAGRTCSKLSSTRSRRRVRRYSFRLSRTGRPPRSGISSAWAIVAGTSAGSAIGASPTKWAPSGKRSSSSAATWRPRWVLPVPAGPVSVTRRACPDVGARPREHRPADDVVAAAVSRSEAAVGESIPALEGLAEGSSRSRS